MPVMRVFAMVVMPLAPAMRMPYVNTFGNWD